MAGVHSAPKSAMRFNDANEITMRKGNAGEARGRRHYVVSWPPPNSAVVNAIRNNLRSAVRKAKTLGWPDGIILLEFWHALDRENGIEPIAAQWQKEKMQARPPK